MVAAAFGFGSAGHAAKDREVLDCGNKLSL